MKTRWLHNVKLIMIMIINILFPIQRYCDKILSHNEEETILTIFITFLTKFSCGMRLFWGLLVLIILQSASTGVKIRFPTYGILQFLILRRLAFFCSWKFTLSC